MVKKFTQIKCITAQANETVASHIKFAYESFRSTIMRLSIVLVKGFNILFWWIHIMFNFLGVPLNCNSNCGVWKDISTTKWSSVKHAYIAKKMTHLSCSRAHKNMIPKKSLVRSHTIKLWGGPTNFFPQITIKKCN